MKFLSADTRGKVLRIGSGMYMVSPALAEDLLSCSTIPNRAVSDRVVTQYARAMARSAWRATHQGIALSDAGDVIDGQHRLLAIVQSGRTVPLSIFVGVDPEAFAVLDSGYGRKSGQVLSLAGYVNANYLAAIARQELVVSWRAHKQSITNEAVLRCVEYYEERGMPESVITSKHARAALQAMRLSGALVSWAKWRAMCALPEQAAEFFRKLENMEGSRGEPVHALRLRLLEKQRAAKEHRTALDQLVLVSVAWRAHVEGREMRRIQLPKTMPQMHELPAPGLEPWPVEYLEDK